MTGWLDDLRYAVRGLLRNRGFAAVLTLTLTLGIGANAIVFSLANSILIKATPSVVDPRHLVAVYTSERSGTIYGASSFPDYLDFRARSGAFVGLAAYAPKPASLSAGGRAFVVPAELVSADYFSVLGVHPAVGRTFQPGEGETPGGEGVAVISYGLWQRLFGGHRDVRGRAIRLSGRPFSVIGVAPAGFSGLVRGIEVEIWVPAGMLSRLDPTGPGLSERGARSFFLVGRLRAGVSLKRAQADLDLVARQLRQAHQPDDFAGAQAQGLVTVLPQNEAAVNPRLRGAVSRFLGFLMAAAILVMLICCTNLANLLLVRGTGRQREMAIRFALGASRARLVRLLLTESLLPSVVGAMLALGMAEAAARAVERFGRSLPIPIQLNVAPDGRVLAFAIALALLTCVFFALIPSLRVTEHAPSRMLHGLGAGRGPVAWRAGRRDLLVVAQVAVSSVLLVVAGLFVRGLWRAEATDLGFETNTVVVVPLNLSLQGYAGSRRETFLADLLAGVRRLPGVLAASLAKTVPLGMAAEQRGVQIEANPAAYGVVNVNVVDAGYFRVMSIPLLQGRDFSEADRTAAAQVAVVNAAFATKYWPGMSALGRHLNTGTGPREVVGVVANGTYGASLEEGVAPFLYLPSRQEQAQDMALVVRTLGGASATVPALRGVFGELDPDLPVEPRTMSDYVRFAVLPQRLAVLVVGGVGLLGILLASVGLYGVLAYGVARRSHEIGVRMALGLEAGAVLRSVIAQGVRLVTLGLLPGLTLAFLAGLAVRGVAFGVGGADLGTCVTVITVFAIVAVVASFGPARRATRIEPAELLRSE